jgi:mRNA-degrading endonuclease toxin of MazEF toxin-antitoxin module
VYDWPTAPSGRRRVVVLSDDAYNEHAWPVCAMVARAGPASPYAVSMADPDPIGGRIVLGSVGALPADQMEGPLGTVTGATWDRVTVGLRAMFGL